MHRSGARRRVSVSARASKFAARVAKRVDQVHRSSAGRAAAAVWLARVGAGASARSLRVLLDKHTPTQLVPNAESARPGRGRYECPLAPATVPPSFVGSAGYRLALQSNGSATTVERCAGPVARPLPAHTGSPWEWLANAFRRGSCVDGLYNLRYFAVRRQLRFSLSL